MADTLRGQRESRILFHETFDGNGFTTNNSLAQMRIVKPDQINPVITHLMGKEEDIFPLTFLTEGQKGGSRKIEIQDIEYEWPVMGRPKISDTIVNSDYSSSDDSIGAGGVPVKAVFKSNWLKNQHTVVTPSGSHLRIQGKPRPVGSGGFEYVFQLIYSNPTEAVPFSDFLPGTKWSMMGGAAVSEAYSSGNESNKQAPAKLKNQISVLRKSFEIGGNVSNRTVEFQFNIKGKTTSYWMPFEEYQHEIEFKKVCEEHLWWSRYNRDAQGRITTIDPETQLPIPIGAGVDDQIYNRDTYGILTADKIASTVSDVMYGATDKEGAGKGGMEVILYTGIGGMEEFDRAIKRDANGLSGWTLLAGNVADKFVRGSGTHNLAYGAYFNQYAHVNGHIITVKHLPLLDYGGRADNAPSHPVSGKPITSYEMYFVDQSMYDGERNVQMVSQKGRSMIRGIEQGMTLYKGMAFESYMSYKGNALNLNLATDQDKTSIHFMKTLGVVIRRNTHCFKLSCDLGQ